MLRIVKALVLAACALFLISAVSSAFEPSILPDGTECRTWEREWHFTHTYHVAQENPKSSDANPGTEALPWKTIGKAAKTLKPGERVVVHKGTYREWVKPERGGSGPDKIISYEAGPGEDVIITGSDVWKPKWEHTKYVAGVPKGVVTWQAEIDPKLFERANTFCLQNFPAQENFEAWKMYPTFELRRGQIFVDGVQLEQLASYGYLGSKPGFWVEDDGMTVHVRLPDDSAPGRHEFEITTREQVFAPLTRFLNYIRVKGFRMMRAANGVPIPPPQRGLLSAAAGHHWIVEDCEIGYANTVGMDLGGQFWGLYPPGDLQGFHIIRRNYIHHCGITGICAWHNRGNENMIIEDNLLTDNCWMPVDLHYESAAIKIHQMENSVIRRNVILRNGLAAIWLDGEASNSRITQNLVAGVQGGSLGAGFVEITAGPVLVDNNILVNQATDGLHTQDSGKVILAQNLCAVGRGCAIRVVGIDETRLTGQPKGLYQDDNRVIGNILTGFPHYIQIPNRTTLSDYNVFGGRSETDSEEFRIEKRGGVDKEKFDMAGWRAQGYDMDSPDVPITVVFDIYKLELSVKAPAGFELPVISPPPALPALSLQPSDYGDAKLPPHIPRRSITVAPLTDLLRCDLLGRPRDREKFEVGPLLCLPLDGTPVKVDPRR